jgi:hypothetical protein
MSTSLILPPECSNVEKLDLLCNKCINWLLLLPVSLHRIKTTHSENRSPVFRFASFAKPIMQAGHQFLPHFRLIAMQELDWFSFGCINGVHGRSFCLRSYVYPASREKSVVTLVFWMDDKVHTQTFRMARHRTAPMEFINRILYRGPLVIALANPCVVCARPTPHLSTCLQDCFDEVTHLQPCVSPDVEIRLP